MVSIPTVTLNTRVQLHARTRRRRRRRRHTHTHTHTHTHARTPTHARTRTDTDVGCLRYSLCLLVILLLRSRKSSPGKFPGNFSHVKRLVLLLSEESLVGTFHRGRPRQAPCSVCGVLLWPQWRLASCVFQSIIPAGVNEKVRSISLSSVSLLELIGK